MLERILGKKRERKRPAVSTACLYLFLTLPWGMYITSLCQSGQELGRGYLLKYFRIKFYQLTIKKNISTSSNERTKEISAAILGI